LNFTKFLNKIFYFRKQRNFEQNKSFQESPKSITQGAVQKMN